MDGKYDREVLELGVQGLPVVDDIQIAAAAAASDFEHSTSTTSSPYTSSSSSDDDDGNDDENIMAPTYLHRPGHQGRCFGNAHTSQEKVQSSCRVRLEAVQEGRIALQINVQSGSGRAVGYADLSSDSLSNVSSSSDDNEEEEEEEEEIELESDTEEIQDYGEIRRIIDAMDGEIEESATFPPAASELFGSVPPPQLETFSILSDEPLSEAGQIMSVIEGTIVVRASSGSRALDEGSILVLEDRTVLGVIEDIFGPVQAPLYALRCSSQVNDNVKPQAKVFSVDRLAQFVLPDQLRVKGYDDGEMVNGEESVQQDEAHFSDDEAVSCRVYLLTLNS